MQVFLTGATGHLGFAVARKLSSAGHEVIGLTRSPTQAQQLRQMGVIAVSGQLEDEQLVRSHLRQAEAVIHCAVDLGSAWQDSQELNRRFSSWLVEDCGPRGCRLILSQGPQVYGDTGNEVATQETALVDVNASEAERLCLEAGGLSTAVIRLPVVVYGEGGGLVLPALIKAALKHNHSTVIEEGANIFSTIHVEDAATLYLKALNSSASGVFLATGGVDVSLCNLAVSVGRMLDYPVRRVSRAEADSVWNPSWARLLGLNHRLSPARAMREFYWQPRNQPSVLEDLEAGSYAARYLSEAIRHPRI